MTQPVSQPKVNDAVYAVTPRALSRRHELTTEEIERIDDDRRQEWRDEDKEWQR